MTAVSGKGHIIFKVECAHFHSNVLHLHYSNVLYISNTSFIFPT